MELVEATEIASVDLSRTEFLPTGLRFAPGISYAEWVGIGKALHNINRSVHWWIGDWLNFGEQRYGQMYTQAMAETGFDYDTLAMDRRVAERFDFTRRRVNLSFAHHAEVVSLPEPEQERTLCRAEQEELSSREVRQVVRDERAKAAAAVPIPNGKFRVIYADPPWQYGDRLVEGYGAAEHHYPTMSIAELCQVPVIDRVGPNAVLFLWVTSPLLRECFAVVEAWGFDYRSSFVWDKVDHNFGHYNSVRHELLLVCTRGLCLPEVQTLHDSVVSLRRTERHSEKPAYFRQMIDKLYPTGPRIELFARARVDGWMAWGDEA